MGVGYLACAGDGQDKAVNYMQWAEEHRIDLVSAAADAVTGIYYMHMRLM
jgi:hypothetical protein